LWKRTFNEKEKTVIAVKNVGKNGHKFHDTVIDIFLTEYENTQKLKIPKDYSSKLAVNTFCILHKGVVDHLVSFVSY
jgi:hypothetical protein